MIGAIINYCANLASAYSKSSSIRAATPATVPLITSPELPQAKNRELSITIQAHFMSTKWVLIGTKSNPGHCFSVRPGPMPATKTARPSPFGSTSLKKLGGAQGFVDLFWPGFAGEALSDKHRNAIEQAAQCVLDARAQFADASLADLYDPLIMPPALLKAHQKLDTAVDAAYQPSGGKKTYASDAERVAFLFELYQRITSLLPAGATKKKPLNRKNIFTGVSNANN
jgi:hypothetical protein